MFSEYRWVSFMPPNSPDQTPPADWKRPYWRHDPTSGRWTALLPYGRPDTEDKRESTKNHLQKMMKFRLNQWQMCTSNPFKMREIKPNATHSSFVAFHFDLDSFWYAIFSSPQSFTCGQSGLSEKPALVYDTLIHNTDQSILPCSQPWRRSCCSANFKPRLFSCTTSAICVKRTVWRVLASH